MPAGRLESGCRRELVIPAQRIEGEKIGCRRTRDRQALLVDRFGKFVPGHCRSERVGDRRLDLRRRPRLLPLDARRFGVAARDASRIAAVASVTLNKLAGIDAGKPLVDLRPEISGRVLVERYMLPKPLTTTSSPSLKTRERVAGFLGEGVGAFALVGFFRPSRGQSSCRARARASSNCAAVCVNLHAVRMSPAVLPSGLLIRSTARRCSCCGFPCRLDWRRP